MEALYLVTQAHPSELGGEGFFFDRKRLDFIIFAVFLESLEMLW